MDLTQRYELLGLTRQDLGSGAKIYRARERSTGRLVEIHWYGGGGPPTAEHPNLLEAGTQAGATYQVWLATTGTPKPPLHTAGMWRASSNPNHMPGGPPSATPFPPHRAVDGDGRVITPVPGALPASPATTSGTATRVFAAILQGQTPPQNAAAPPAPREEKEFTKIFEPPLGPSGERRGPPGEATSALLGGSRTPTPPRSRTGPTEVPREPTSVSVPTPPAKRALGRAAMFPARAPSAALPPPPAASPAATPAKASHPIPWIAYCVLLLLAVVLILIFALRG